MNLTGFDFWEIRYRGSEQPKIIDGDLFESAQKFVDEHNVTSIIFYVDIIIEISPNRPVSKGRFYEKSITKDELALVSREWIDERRKEVGQLVNKLLVDNSQNSNR
jgi:hypothetical protein